MKTLHTDIITEKNKLATGGAWLTFLTITTSGITPWRMVNDMDDQIYDGNTYTATPFTLQSVKETLQGSLPQLTITISNAGDIDNGDGDLLMDYLNSRDGLVGDTVNLIVTSSDHLTAAAPVDETFSIIEASADLRWINLKVGVTDPLLRRFPRDRYVATTCRHLFTGPLCRYMRDDDRGSITSSLISFNHIAPKFETIHDFILLQPYAAYKVIVDGVERNTFSDGCVIEVSGSQHNDGIYAVEAVLWSGSFYGGDWTGYWYREMGGAHFKLPLDYNLTTEAAGATITITALCNHTLTSCRILGNSDHYGGSPGVAQGVYG